MLSFCRSIYVVSYSKLVLAAWYYSSLHVTFVAYSCLYVLLLLLLLVLTVLCLLLVYLGYSIADLCTCVNTDHLYKQPFHSLCHLLICHSTSISRFLLMWLELVISTSSCVLFSLLTFVGCISCLTIAHCLFVLGYWSHSLHSAHDLFCYCVCPIP